MHQQELEQASSIDPAVIKARGYRTVDSQDRDELRKLGIPAWALTAALWRLERAGRFPPRMKLSARRIGWLEMDVEAWILWRSEHRKVLGRREGKTHDG